jgi:hypothetical protein
LLKFEQIEENMMAHNFNEVVERIFELPLEDKMELIDLLEHHIAEAKRDQISDNYKNALSDLNAGKMNFSSDIDVLKGML